MNFGLKQDAIERINNVFSKFPMLQEVILYGSRAKGNYRPGSDIDLTMAGDQLNYSVLSEISLQLDDLLLPYLFDLSIIDQIKSPELLDHISRVGKVFYSKK